MRRTSSNRILTEVEMATTPEPKPPIHIDMTPECMKIWSILMRTREYAMWTEVDLEHAVNLASTFADMEKLRRELRNESDITISETGVEKISAKHLLIDILTKRAISLSRLLHVHPEATAGKSTFQVNRNKKHRQIVKDLESDENSLLASRTIN